MNILRKLTEPLGFYASLRWKRARRGVLMLLPLLSIAAAYVAFAGRYLPTSGFIAILLSVLLVLSLEFYSLSLFLSLIFASTHKRLDLVRMIDLDLHKVIERAENASPLLCEPEIRSMAREFGSDFAARRLFPRLATVLLSRMFCFFALTILAFSFITLSVIKLSGFYKTSDQPYKHVCVNGTDSFPSVLAHLVYYHSVIFQSLGDGDHTPQRFWPQILATFETFTALLYSLVIFAGVLSVAVYVESEVTPEKLVDELARRLLSLSPNASQVVR